MVEMFGCKKLIKSMSKRNQRKVLRVLEMCCETWPEDTDFNVRIMIGECYKILAGPVGRRRKAPASAGGHPCREQRER